MRNTAIAMLSNISASQNEIIGAIFKQLVTFIPDATIIDFYKENKLNKVLTGEPDVMKAEQWEYDGWRSVYKHYRYMLRPFDNVIIFRAPSLRGYQQTTDEQMLRDIEAGVKKDDHYCWSGYELMKRNIERVLFVKACKDKRVIQYVIDPTEVDFREVYQIPEYLRLGAMETEHEYHAPFFEWALSDTFVQEIPKAQDFYYIASVLTPEREYLNDVVAQINTKFGKRVRGGKRPGTDRQVGMRNCGTTGKIALYDAKGRRDVRVGQSTYYYNLMLSRYTIITRPYDIHQFNMVRFLEAVIMDCCPLILKDVSLRNLVLTFPDIYDIIKKRGLIWQDSLERMYAKAINYNYSDDNTVCSEIKATKSWQELIDPEKIQQYFDEILG